MNLIALADTVRGENGHMVTLEGGTWAQSSDTRILLRTQIEVDETGREAW